MDQIFIYYLIIVNLGAFFLYGIDKRKAQLGEFRISERNLLLAAAAGGSLGALLGMRVFHHKTKKWKFRLGVPGILVLQAAAVYFLFYK